MGDVTGICHVVAAYFELHSSQYPDKKQYHIVHCASSYFVTPCVIHYFVGSSFTCARARARLTIWNTRLQHIWFQRRLTPWSVAGLDTSRSSRPDLGMSFMNSGSGSGLGLNESAIADLFTTVSGNPAASIPAEDRLAYILAVSDWLWSG